MGCRVGGADKTLFTKTVLKNIHLNKLLYAHNDKAHNHNFTSSLMWWYVSRSMWLVKTITHHSQWDQARPVSEQQKNHTSLLPCWKTWTNEPWRTSQQTFEVLEVDVTLWLDGVTLQVSFKSTKSTDQSGTDTAKTAESRLQKGLRAESVIRVLSHF